MGIGVGLVTGSTGAGVAATLASVLVDVDHILDYTFSNGGFRSLSHMFDFCYRGNLKRFFLLAHSYELWTIAALTLPPLLPGPVIWGVLLGWLLHLLLDQLFNPCKIWTYLFIARLAHRFQPEHIGTPTRNLYTDLALRSGLPRPNWTRPGPKRSG